MWAESLCQPCAFCATVVVASPSFSPCFAGRQEAKNTKCEGRQKVLRWSGWSWVPKVVPLNEVLIVVFNGDSQKKSLKQLMTWKRKVLNAAFLSRVDRWSMMVYDGFFRGYNLGVGSCWLVIWIKLVSSNPQHLNHQLSIVSYHRARMASGWSYINRNWSSLVFRRLPAVTASWVLLKYGMRKWKSVGLF